MPVLPEKSSVCCRTQSGFSPPLLNYKAVFLRPFSISILQHMPHFHLLGLQVEGVVGIGFDLDRHALSDLQTEFLELIDLVRVVGQDPHGLDAQFAQDLCADKILALIARKAQSQIGFQSPLPS